MYELGEWPFAAPCRLNYTSHACSCSRRAVSECRNCRSAPPDPISQLCTDCTARTRQAYTDAVSEDPSRLLASHVDVWRRLWTSGFSISHSLADDVINGDVINATLYYVMSQARAPLHEKVSGPWRGVSWWDAPCVCVK